MLLYDLIPPLQLVERELKRLVDPAVHPYRPLGGLDYRIGQVDVDDVAVREWCHLWGEPVDGGEERPHGACDRTVGRRDCDITVRSGQPVHKAAENGSTHKEPCGRSPRPDEPAPPKGVGRVVGMEPGKPVEAGEARAVENAGGESAAHRRQKPAASRPPEPGGAHHEPEQDRR